MYLTLCCQMYCGDKIDIQPKHAIFTSVVLEIFKVISHLNMDGDKMSKEYNLTASRWRILGGIGLSESFLTGQQ